MIKAIIWDMDGVIIDSEGHHSQAEVEIFKSFGANVTPEENSQFKGTPLHEHLAKAKELFKINASVEELTDKLNESIEETFSTRAELFQNAHEVITQLKKTFKIALATSTKRDFVNIVLKRFNLENVFDVIVCGDEINAGKPDPEIFLKTAKKLEIRSNECLVIEDSLNGFRAAKSAEMNLVAFKTHHNQDIDFSLADYIVEDLGAIPGILEKTNNP